MTMVPPRYQRLLKIPTQKPKESGRVAAPKRVRLASVSAEVIRRRDRSTRQPAARLLDRQSLM
jgi:hypothetical protein